MIWWQDHPGKPWCNPGTDSDLCLCWNFWAKQKTKNSHRNGVCCKERKSLSFEWWWTDCLFPEMRQIGIFSKVKMFPGSPLADKYRDWTRSQRTSALLYLKMQLGLQRQTAIYGWRAIFVNRQ